MKTQQKVLKAEPVSSTQVTRVAKVLPANRSTEPTSDLSKQVVPWHLRAVLNASEAVLEPYRGIAKAVVPAVSSAQAVQ